MNTDRQQKGFQGLEEWTHPFLSTEFQSGEAELWGLLHSGNALNARDVLMMKPDMAAHICNPSTSSRPAWATG